MGFQFPVSSFQSWVLGLALRLGSELRDAKGRVVLKHFSAIDLFMSEKEAQKQKTLEVDCVLCGTGTGKKPLKKLKARSSDIELVRCSKCGLAFLSPRLATDEVKAVYEDDTLNNSQYYSDPASLDDDKRAFASRLMFASNFAKGRETIVDIGASVGTFLSVAREAGFKKIHGVELNPRSRAKAKELFSLEFTEKLPQGVRADMINMSDLIEHVENPLKFLSDLRANLKEDGILLITTPDFDRWVTHMVNIKPDEHLFYFTKETLNKTLEQAGFDVLHMGNTTRFRRFKQLAQSTTAKNPLIRFGLKAFVTLHLDGISERILFKDLNNDILCVARPKKSDSAAATKKKM